MDTTSLRTITAALVLLWLCGTGQCADTDTRVLGQVHLEPNSESIGKYLKSITDDTTTKKAAADLFAQLLSDDFRTRQKAIIKLKAMPNVPDEILQKAVKSGAPESATIAKQLIKRQSLGQLNTDLVTFACLRIAAKKKLPNLAADIFKASSSFKSAEIKKAASVALSVCATPEDDTTIRAAATKSEIAKAYIALRDASAEQQPSIPSWSDFFDAQIIVGDGEGDHQTAFVKADSPRIVACFGVTTKTADTTGSVAARRIGSPWLYPDKNHGEIPKVLEIDGKRLYPIWGTWRQHWSSYILELNENGSLIGGGSHDGQGSIHKKSTVDFIVVPISE